MWHSKHRVGPHRVGPNRVGPNLLGQPQSTAWRGYPELPVKKGIQVMIEISPLLVRLPPDRPGLVDLPPPG